MAPVTATTMWAASLLLAVLLGVIAAESSSVRWEGARAEGAPSPDQSSATRTEQIAALQPTAAIASAAVVQTPTLKLIPAAESATLASLTHRDDRALLLQCEAVSPNISTIEVLLKRGANASTSKTLSSKSTCLHFAAIGNNIILARLLLQYRAPTYAVDISGQVPLCYASGHDGTELAELLLQGGADPNAQCASFFPSKPWPLLHLAVEDRNTKLVALLLRSKASPNAKDLDSDTALCVLLLSSGSAHRRVEIAEELLQHGADPHLECGGTWMPLCRVFDTNSTEVLPVLLQHNADPNQCGQDGLPLNQAVRQGSNKDLELILQHGGDPNRADEFDGMTPLLAAISDRIVGDWRQKVELLLHYKADPLITNEKNGLCPLRWAVDTKVTTNVELMLLNPNSADKSNQTLLLRLSDRGDLELAQLVLAHGADPNLAAQDGTTPLWRAASKGRKELVTLLLKFGATANIADKEGKTSLDVAMEYEWKRSLGNIDVGMIMSLLDSGATTSGKAEVSLLCLLARDKYRDGVAILLGKGSKYKPYHGDKESIDGALFCSASGKAVHALVDEGANLTARNRDGDTPVDVAALMQLWGAVAALLSRGAPLSLTVMDAARNATIDLGFTETSIVRGISDASHTTYTGYHWSVYFCDPYATISWFNESTNTKDDDGATPFTIANKNREYCPGIYKMLEAMKLKQDKEESDNRIRHVGDVMVGIIAAFGAACSLGVQTFVLLLGTLTHKSRLMPLIPWLLFGTGSAWVACLEIEANRASVVGATSLTVWALMTVLVALVGPGCSLSSSVNRLKRWGARKRDSCWWVVDCSFVGCAGACIIAVEVGQARTDPLQFCSGLVFLSSAAASWHSHVTPDTDVATPLQCSAGMTIVVVAGLGYFIGWSRPTPATILVACAMLASASTKLCPQAADRVHRSVHIEMQGLEENKFCAARMVFGRAGSAAQGIEQHLGLSAQQLADGLARGTQAMEDEVRMTGDADDLDNFGYVAHRQSLKPDHIPRKIAETLSTGIYHGGNIKPEEFDTGHAGRWLCDWMNLEEVKIANLTEAEFVAVRFYTSPSFWRINGPLRRGEKHLWPMVVYFLFQGIKKLRAVQAVLDPELFASETILWRGMKNMALDIAEFKAIGGTELAPMSTTSSEDVAKHYSQSKVPLVFKYKVAGLKAGACIQFLSLYPKEQEFVYPPLTYLTYRSHFDDDGVRVVVVEPVMS